MTAGRKFGYPKKYTQINANIIMPEKTLLQKEIKKEEDQELILSDGVKEYLNSIWEIPLLTAEEEKQYAYIAKYSKSEKERKKARNELVNHNLRYVISIAKRYIKVAATMDFMDLIQEGNIGLMTAAKKFDVDKGYRFTSYATFWITQGITRSLENSDRPVRLPTYIVQLYFAIYKAQEKRQSCGLRPFTKAEIKKEFHITEDTYKRILMVPQGTMAHLDTIIAGKNGEKDDCMTLGDLIASEQPTPELIAVGRDTSMRIDNVLKKCLSEKEQYVITHRFGLHDCEVETLNAIGFKFGVSRERIRQIEAGAMKKLTHIKKRDEEVLRACL